MALGSPTGKSEDAGRRRELFSETGGGSVYRAFGRFAVAAALALAVATFVIFAGFSPIKPSGAVVMTLLTGDALVVVTVLALIGVELLRLRSARRASRAGARLHTRVITLFSLVAGVPAAVTAVVAAVSVEWAINPAFMNNIGAFVQEANHASLIYRETACKALLREADLTAADLGKSARLLQSDPELFQTYFDERARALGFDVAAVLKSDDSRTVVAKGSDENLLANLRPSDFEDAKGRQPFCGLLQGGAVFVALRPIDGIDDSFLYAGRTNDPAGDRLSNDASGFSDLLTAFLANRRNIELGFAIVFVMLASTLLISAVWIGFTFADYIVAPIRRLIRATDEVATGNLYVQVPVHKSEGDLGHLGETFNKMTEELRHQRSSLMAANALAEQRLVFIEATLAGVPAGVIGVDGDGVITLANDAAERLTGAEPNGLPGKTLDAVSERLGEILTEARSGRSRLVQGQATLAVNGRERLINVRATGDPNRPEQGLVLTLDDITDLVSAQRSAAWADVARRIAHEIKNPLTPIQLSAERLKRRWGRHIVEGKEVFDQCTDTIIRQVDDIKRMVDEFSSFARMPRARLTRDHLTDCVRQALFLARVGRADIAFEDEMPAEPLWAEFDRRLMSQALTNVLKNASEGVDARPSVDEKGRIKVSLSVDGEGRARIAISDNGKGFPTEDRHKLREPYVTTRAEGTGLGLPIVIKVLEDHGGVVDLIDGLPRADGGVGAQVVMTFPLHQRSADEAGAQTSNPA